MSSTMPTQAAPLPPSRDQATPDLAALRAELDRLDNAIHDLLMRRAEVVREVAATKGGVALRLGREAAIIRRLLARHEGGLPPQTLVRLWRELLAGTTSMQAPFIIAVCSADAADGAVACAREQFGALTPLHVYPTPAQAIREISAGRASAAVLPVPAEGEPASAAWWTALLQKDDPRIHVVGRLPFWTARPEGAPRAQALVAAAVPPDPSGDDRSLLGLEIPTDLSRARLSAALADAGFAPGAIILRREPGAASATVLADVAGFVVDDDTRLAAISPLLRPPVVLGAYAIPIEGDPR
jgi:chorismate mutase